MVALTLSTIWTFNQFTVIWLLTQGGPGEATTTLPIAAYQQAFVAGSKNLSRGAVFAVLTFPVLVVLVLLLNHFVASREEGRGLTKFWRTGLQYARSTQYFCQNDAGNEMGAPLQGDRRYAVDDLHSHLGVVPNLLDRAASFKHPKDLAVRIPLFWTWEPTLMSYRGLFTQPFLQFERLTLNSLTISLGATFLSVVIAVFAGLALARLRFPGRQRLGMAVFFAYLVPPVLLFIPLYVVMAKFRLVDSRLGLILVYSSFTVPFCVWMLRGYFHNIPVRAGECAMIDGCTRVGAWVRIVLAAGIARHRRRRHLRLHHGLE